MNTIRRNIFYLISSIRIKYDVKYNIEYSDLPILHFKSINKEVLDFILNKVILNNFNITSYIYDDKIYKDFNYQEINGEFDISLIINKSEEDKDNYKNLIATLNRFTNQHKLEIIDYLNLNHESDLGMLKTGDKVVAYFGEHDKHNTINSELITVAYVYINHDRIFLIQNKFDGNLPDYYSSYKLNDWRRYGDKSWVISTPHKSGIDFKKKDFFIYSKIK